MKTFATVVAACLLCAGTATAQQVSTCPAPRSLAVSAADSIKPDIAIIARVQAAELRFNSQPQSSLQLFGCPQVDTSLVVVRTNLPKPVQPGVTYNNVIIDFKLNVKLRELECYLAGGSCPARDSTGIR